MRYFQKLLCLLILVLAASFGVRSVFLLALTRSNASCSPSAPGVSITPPIRSSCIGWRKASGVRIGMPNSQSPMAVLTVDLPASLGP